MRVVLPAKIALAALAGGCANYKVYETGLEVCRGSNGSVRSATITRSSGDPEIDAYAVEKVAPSLAYAGSDEVTCRPLTVEYRVTGERGRTS